MHRLGPSPRGELRQQARAIVDRLSDIEGRWLDGSPPSPEQLDSIADDLARLRAGLADGPSVAPWDGQPPIPRPS